MSCGGYFISGRHYSRLTDEGAPVGVMIAAVVSETSAEAAAAVVTSSGVAVVTLCAPPPPVPGEDWAESGAWSSAAAACDQNSLYSNSHLWYRMR